MNLLRRLFGLHVHQWGEIECAFLETANASRHAHAQWCETCGDYKMVYHVTCYNKSPSRYRAAEVTKRPATRYTSTKGRSPGS